MSAPDETASKKESRPCNLANTLKALGKLPPDFAWFDEFHQKILTGNDGSEPREWSDLDTLNLTNHLQSGDYRLSRVSEKTVLSAVRVYADARTRNEVHEFMEALKWDGKPRIEEFLFRAMSAESNLYTTAASRNFWISMVARTYSPGSKLDTILIAEGKQGTLKSSAFREIGGRWYAEVSTSIDSKDFLLSFAGKLVVELSELAAFSSSKADANLLKKTLSTQVDRYRPPYDKAAQDFPRRCVLVGTTNDDEYLKDQTGGRRFWPVRTGRIDLAYIRENRDQLFAEAVAEYKKGASWWEMPEVETAAEQEARRETDPWEAKLEEWLETGLKGMQPPLEVCSSSKILEECFSIEPKHQKQAEKLRVTRILKLLGWKSARSSDPKERTRLWRRPRPHLRTVSL